MTVEIPETVYAQARAIVNDAKDPVSVAYLVALGIFSERNRCATIARGDDTFSGDRIATAIQAGDAP